RRGFRQSALGASFGAVLFAFSAPRVNQLSHLQLLPHFWSLGCLYALLRLFAPAGRPPSDAEQRGWIWIFFLCAAMQLLASFYLGWFLGLALALAAVGGGPCGARRRSVGNLRGSRGYAVAAAAAAATLLLLPMALHFYAASRDMGF